MKTVLIFLKNSALGVLGVCIIAIITNAVDVSRVDDISIFVWIIYIACKVTLELIESEIE